MNTKLPTPPKGFCGFKLFLFVLMCLIVGTGQTIFAQYATGRSGTYRNQVTAQDKIIRSKVTTFNQKDFYFVISSEILSSSKLFLIKKDGLQSFEVNQKFFENKNNGGTK